MRVTLYICAVINILLLSLGGRMLTSALAQAAEKELSQVHEVVSLHDESSKIWRELLVLEDNGEPKLHTVIYRNGARLFEKLENGVVRESVETFSLADGAGEKRLASFDANGKLSKEKVLRKEGTVERQGERRADGGWQESELDKDGALVATRSFDSLGMLESESHFKSGRLTVMVRGDAGVLRIDAYSEEAQLQSSTWESASGYERFISYFPGERIAYEETREQYTTRRTAYDESGAVIATCVFSHDGLLRYTQISGGKPLFEQSWFKSSSRWSLRQTVTFNADGSVKATYNFDHSSKNPIARSIVFNATASAPERTEEYYATGFLQRITITNASGEEEVQEFEEGKADRPAISEDLFKQPENMNPTVQPVQPPPMNEHDRSSATATPIPHSSYFTRRGP